MTKLIKHTVIIKTVFEGFHYWREAPDEVDYLRSEHRHMFHVRVEVPVNKLDREIEVITCKQFVNKTLSSLIESIKRDGWSCEMIANVLAGQVAEEYHADWCYVEVLEDDENGGSALYERVLSK